ncbi:hypothetical protein LLY41_14335 [Cytobacillus firmus]|uniref:hypothetical protein n=1 Tax=Cytobacillus firmus TaxID=1399 RepID=UPI002184C4AE|nr:hypothetical protein [Cytobacillus firmus]URM31596.1 hypothetical protein LLY41_14335 [Cytobacillus firmus]
MARRKYTKQQWTTCKFVGKGEEDLIDIVKRQFVRYVNEQYGYPVIGLKDDIIKEHFREGYRKAKK